MLRILRQRSHQANRFLALGFAALLFALLLQAALPGWFSQGLNDFACRYLYYFSASGRQPLRIIGVAVDEYSLAKLGQRWPWQRSVYARMLTHLDQAGAAVVGFDLAFVGESQDPAEDLALSSAIKNAKCRTVIAYFFDPENRSPVWPLAGLKEAAYSCGMLNTPLDSDSKVRKLRAKVSLKDESFYSFSVALASAYLGQEPVKIANSIPLSADGTFALNFLIKEKDINILSAYDVFNGLGEYKDKYGKDFLKGALVVVYPQANILHDSHMTALGSMPGGLLHLNGAANIIKGSFLKESRAFGLLAGVLSFIGVVYILTHTGFVAGTMFTFGLILLDFWVLVLSGIRGIRYDFSFCVIFTALFFSFGSLFKYFSFLAKLLTIRANATRDPLTGLYTVKYLEHILSGEQKEIHYGKALFLVFVSLKGAAQELSEKRTEEIKQFWQKISACLNARARHWSVYSADEFAGCLFSRRKGIIKNMAQLKSEIDRVLNRGGIKLSAAISAFEFNNRYPLAISLSALAQKSLSNRGRVVVLDESDLAAVKGDRPSLTEEQFLEGLGEDIEEKNRQLLNLIDNLRQEHAKTKEAYFQIISSLVNALEARDQYTQGHSQRVAQYALTLAESLNWGREDLDKLNKAALLHDLGKIGIPDSVLHKKGPLDDREYELIRKHEVIGVRILEPLSEFAQLLPWILYHHERWDGTGYPQGLAQDNIPLGAQIISLADVFDAITTGRDYKPAFPVEQAIEEIRKAKGSQFNPQLADKFIEVIPKFSVKSI